MDYWMEPLLGTEMDKMKDLRLDEKMEHLLEKTLDLWTECLSDCMLGLM